MILHELDSSYLRSDETRKSVVVCLLIVRGLSESWRDMKRGKGECKHTHIPLLLLYLDRLVQFDMFLLFMIGYRHSALGFHNQANDHVGSDVRYTASRGSINIEVVQSQFFDRIFQFESKRIS